MREGGYQIIDLNDFNFSHNAALVLEGVYEAVEGTQKPILISGLVFNGLEIPDAFVQRDVAGTDFILTGIPYLVICVTQEDVVTLSCYKDTIHTTSYEEYVVWGNARPYGAAGTLFKFSDNQRQYIILECINGSESTRMVISAITNSGSGDNRHVEFRKNSGGRWEYTCEE